MMRYITALLSALLCINCFDCAAQDNLFETSLVSKQQQWRNVDVNMSFYDYRKACRHNRRLLLDGLSQHTERALASIGLPGKGFQLIGAAASLSFHGARMQLGKRKTLAFGLNRIRHKDRALYLRISMDWK